MERSPAGAPGERLAREALGGSRRALARVLTEVESRTEAAEEALRMLHLLAGSAHVVGVTGPPGVGKSTLVSGLVGQARSGARAGEQAGAVAHARARDRKVAVLAIDPSSPVTGGAILGDRVRMQPVAGDEGVFIRSMASRGHAGGLAGATAEAATVLDACGFGLVFIETVGTGQGEVEVAAVADTTVVVQAPEMGDEVQAIKAGLLEVADIVVVTKADRPGADRTAAQLRAMLMVAGAQDERAAGPRPKRPEILLASGQTGDGVAEVLAALDRRYALLAEDGARTEAARLGRARAQVVGIMADRTREALWDDRCRARTEATLRAVAAHELDPYAAADALLRLAVGSD